MFDILHQVISFFFLFRDFYVTVRDDSGVRPELLCGQRDTFTFLAQKLSIDYKSTRYTESWPGFLAQYLVINESIANGNENNTLLTYMTLTLWRPSQELVGAVGFTPYST